VEQVTRVLNHRVNELFPDGAVVRAELLRDSDHPGQLTVRVFIPATEDVAAWAAAHQERMAELREELSLRLPSARLLEFTSDAPDAPVISMPDDGSLAAEQLPSRDIAVRALALLRENYVFPELAEQVATAVGTRIAAGEYDDLDEITLTELLTSHLQEATGDRHLAVRLGGGPRPAGPGPGRPGPGPERPGPGRPAVRRRPGGDDGGGPGDEPADHEMKRLKMRQMGRLDNFGIHRVERLDGNIGYLDLRRMPVPANAGPAIAAAMELVCGTYALVIDARRNGGGSPEGVALWCSYLLPEEPAHLNDIFHADTGETRQFWSLPYLPGSRYLDRPVYVLTSSRTFSGGEDLCYTLQALGRAELIGETTGGGAHPTRPFPISAAVHIAIPFARSVNPVTGTNWQGTGVIPDTQVAADEAYSVAYAKALRHVAELRDAPPPITDEARAALAALPAVAATVPTGQGEGVMVPSLVGMQVTQAEQAAAKAGLRAERRPRAYPNLPPGVVGGQAPAAGSQVPQGATVVVRYAGEGS
jgi:Peptidase family S41/PASTA domain/N-terminal domain of Peptidase_S41 in eukaryotic IRBP